MTDPIGKRMANPWLVLATLSGSVHTFFSAIWAAGSELMVSTVGQVAQEIAKFGPSGRALLLGVIAAAKAAVTAVPLIDAGLRSYDIRFPRFARRCEFIVAASLTAYGSISMAGNAVGLIRGGMGWAQWSAADRTVLWGHLAIWDLLFTLWGVGILGYLITTTPRRMMNKERESC